MSFIRSALTLAAAATFMAAGTANATTITFYKLTSQNGTSVAAQLTVDVTEAANGTVDFTFHNDVGTASSITDIYFEDRTLLALSTVGNNSGVDFAPPAGPSELFGANLASFVTNPGLSAVSRNHGQGVNGATEWVTINFTLQNGQTYTTIRDALTTGDLRIGVQAALNNSAKGFDSYINNRLGSSNQLVSVPEGGSTAALLGSVFLAFAVIRRRLRKS